MKCDNHPEVDAVAVFPKTGYFLLYCQSCLDEMKSRMIYNSNLKLSELERNYQENRAILQKDLEISLRDLSYDIDEGVKRMKELPK